MLLFFCLLLSQVQILCCLWNFMHHLHQCSLCSAVNPHWYQIKLWQSSCSGHYNSSLAVLPCLCHRSYPIPVWPTLIHMHTLRQNTGHQLHTGVLTQSKHHLQLTVTVLYLSPPTSCCGQQFIPQHDVSKHTYAQTDHAVPHYQLGHLYGILASLFFTLSSVVSVSALLFIFCLALFDRTNPLTTVVDTGNTSHIILKWKHDMVTSCRNQHLRLLLAVKIISQDVRDGHWNPVFWTRQHAVYLWRDGGLNLNHWVLLHL